MRSKAKLVLLNLPGGRGMYWLGGDLGSQTT